MRHLLWPAPFAVATALALSLPARAETVVLKNGRTITGKIVASGPEAAILEVQCGSGHGRIKIPRSEIAEVRDDSFSADGITGIAPPTPAGAHTLESAASSDLEARLRELGPSREELLGELEPTPAEAEELAQLERGLDLGSVEAAERLAAKGRPALLVAARALAAPSRLRRAAAAEAVRRLAADERTLPFVLALDLPTLLVACAADDATDESPAARFAARRALEAIAKRDVAAEERASTRALTDAERVALSLWRDWWQNEQKDVASWEEPRSRERTEIRTELHRRGIRPPGEPRGRIEVKTTAQEGSGDPGIPEPKVLLPRLVVHPPLDLAFEGEGAARALGFSVEIENAGVGPFELRVSETTGVQRVLARYPGDERVVTERERTLGRLVPDARHGHPHLDQALRFELLDETFVPALGSRGSDGPLCLRDARRVGAGGPAAPRYDGKGKLVGISVGWETVADLRGPGRSVAIGDVADGVYYLVVGLPLALDGASTPDDLLAGIKLRFGAQKVEVLERLTGRDLRARRAARQRERESP
jgi:hypothetical protein